MKHVNFVPENTQKLFFWGIIKVALKNKKAVLSSNNILGKSNAKFLYFAQKCSITSKSKQLLLTS